MTKNTTKQNNETRAGLSTAQAADAFRRLVTDESQPADARHKLLEWFDQMCNSTGVGLEHPAFFRRAFLMAAKATEETPRKEGRDNVDAHFAWQAYDMIQKTLARTQAGDSLATFHARLESARARSFARTKASETRRRAQAIIADKRYDVDTRDAILNSLQDDAPDVAKLVRHAEKGEIILDIPTMPDTPPPHPLAELASHISAVLNHPLTPRCLRDDLWASVNDLATPESFYNSASYIEGRLSGVAGLPQEGGTH